MRYPAKLVDDVAAFGPDMNLSVQMNDEVPVIVPDECPPATGSACDPLCGRYLYMLFSHSGPGSEATSTFFQLVAHGALDGNLGDAVNLNIAAPGPTAQHYTTENHLVLVPEVQNCGHRTRFNVDYGSNPYVYPVVLPDEPDDDAGEWLDIFMFGIVTTPPYTMTVQLQIDLTDAAVGSETWTDIGPRVNLNNF